MTTFSTSIKEFATEVENADLSTIALTSKSAVSGTSNDKLKFICDNKELLYKAIDIAKIFTGPKGDKLLDTLKSVIESLCA